MAKFEIFKKAKEIFKKVTSKTPSKGSSKDWKLFSLLSPRALSALSFLSSMGASSMIDTDTTPSKKKKPQPKKK